MKLSIKGLAIASGLLWGGAMLWVGVGGMLSPGYGQAFVAVMASVYSGYTPDGSAAMVVVGTLYGLVDGAIGGALLAGLYNLFAGHAAKV